MKISLMFCLLAAGTTIYAGECSQLDILKAQRNGASFDVTLRVVDDRGVPVEGARCEGWKWIDAHKDNGSSYETMTDSNGLARITGKCGKWVSVAVSKEGYYSSQDEIRFNGLKKQGQLGQYVWQPHGAKLSLVLKKIRNPVPMQSHDGLKSFSIPKLDQWIGFDMERYDFVMPYGNGNIIWLDIKSNDGRMVHVPVEICGSLQKVQVGLKVELRKNCDYIIQENWYEFGVF